MATFEYVNRTGKDLLEYMKTSLVSEDRANEKAATTFIKYDGKLLTLQQYTKLKPDAKDLLLGALFPMKSEVCEELDNGDLEFSIDGFDTFVIKKKEVKTSILTRLQAKLSNNNRKTAYTDAILEAIEMMFEISVSDLLKLDFRVMGELVNRVNTFLSECTKVKSSVEIANPFQD